MARSTLIQVRVDDSLKKEADSLFSDLGLDTPTAIRIFLRQSIDHNGLPFDLVRPTPNADTIAALEEADRISRDPSAKRYDSFSDVLSDVMSEVDDEV